VAKRTKVTRKRTTRSSKRKTSARTSRRRTAKKAKPARRSAAKRRPTKAAKKKTAARAAASRSRKPERPKSTFEKATSIARGAALTAVAAITNRLPWATNENDPIALLETDHRRFEKLLEEGEKTTERAAKGRAELLKTLISELNVHEAIEEQVLYPALKPHAEARHIVLNELKSVATDSEKWAAKFKVLKENITHHIKEEERMMFPAARGVLAREELLALGARMRALKAELER
jgi:hemerythrin-like domain-containing protein